MSRSIVVCFRMTGRYADWLFMSMHRSLALICSAADLRREAGRRERVAALAAQPARDRQRPAGVDPVISEASRRFVSGRPEGSPGECRRPRVVVGLSASSSSVSSASSASSVSGSSSSSESSPGPASSRLSSAPSSSASPSLSRLRLVRVVVLVVPVGIVAGARVVPTVLGPVLRIGGVPRLGFVRVGVLVVLGIVTV